MMSTCHDKSSNFYFLNFNSIIVLSHHEMNTNCFRMQYSYCSITQTF